MAKDYYWGLERVSTKPVRAGSSRLKATEPVVCGRTKYDKGASLAFILCVGQSRRAELLDG